MATSPVSPDPGTTSMPCSVITRVVSARRNEADAAEASAVVALVAMPIASDEPSVSTRINRSLWRSSPSLVSFDHITPDEMITRSEEMSQRSGSASRARRIGLAKASPTIVIDFTRSRSIVSSSSTTSKWRPASVTIDPPADNVVKALNRPVPCISGAPGRLDGPGRSIWAARAWTVSGGGRRPRLTWSRARYKSS